MPPSGGLSRGVSARKWGAGPSMIAQTCCWGGYSPQAGGYGALFRGVQAPEWGVGSRNWAIFGESPKVAR